MSLLHPNERRVPLMLPDDTLIYCQLHCSGEMTNGSQHK